MPSAPPPVPIPVATLAYQPPPRLQRPGIMTAVGIISIVLASLSGLSSVGGMFSNLAMIFMSRVGNKIASIQTSPLPAPAQIKTVTVDGIPVDPEGSPDGMPQSQREIVIDGLAALRPMTSLRRNHLDLLLENSGTKMLPFVDDSTTAQDVRDKAIVRKASPRGIDLFAIDTGTVRITDQNATFTPSGKGEIVKADAGISSTTAPAPPVKMPNPFPFQINVTAAIVAICENVVSALVAIMLLVAGILLLRNSPKFWTPHWWFVCLKIPLVIVASIAYWMTYSTMMTSVTSANGVSAPNLGAAMIVPAMMWGIVGLAYPVALIFVLSSRTAKSYYHSVRGIS